MIKSIQKYSTSKLDFILQLNSQPEVTMWQALGPILPVTSRRAHLAHGSSAGRLALRIRQSPERLGVRDLRLRELQK